MKRRNPRAHTLLCTALVTQLQARHAELFRSVHSNPNTALPSHNAEDAYSDEEEEAAEEADSAGGPPARGASLFLQQHASRHAAAAGLPAAGLPAAQAQSQHQQPAKQRRPGAIPDVVERSTGALPDSSAPAAHEGDAAGSRPPSLFMQMQGKR